MPITTQKMFSYVITRMNIDMDASKIACTLREFIDGAPSNDMAFDITGQDFAAFLDQSVDGSKSRADDTTLAVYNYAVSKGIVSGSVS